jgi:ribosome-binding protein aMBF1 (putative translation factor)
MRAKTETRKTTDAVAILDQMAGDSPELRRLTEEARINAAVAQLIYAARNKAGLSQAELADRIGTKQSVISRNPFPAASEGWTWPTAKYSDSGASRLTIACAWH